MTGQDNIIELRGVDKSFEDTRALEGIDLSISNGEFLTLLGLPVAARRPSCESFRASRPRIRETYPSAGSG